VFSLQEQLKRLLNGLKEYMHYKNYKSLERVLSKSFSLFFICSWIETGSVPFEIVIKSDKETA